MKTERITLLGTPEFKAYLALEAGKEGVSLSELVRRRCERIPTEDEKALATLSEALTHAVAEARQSIAEGLEAANRVLEDVRSHRKAA